MASAGGADDDDGLVGGAVVATACSNHIGPVLRLGYPSVEGGAGYT